MTHFLVRNHREYILGVARDGMIVDSETSKPLEGNGNRAFPLPRTRTIDDVLGLPVKKFFEKVSVNEPNCQRLLYWANNRGEFTYQLQDFGSNRNPGNSRTNYFTTSGVELSDEDMDLIVDSAKEKVRAVNQERKINTDLYESGKIDSLYYKKHTKALKNKLKGDIKETLPIRGNIFALKLPWSLSFDNVVRGDATARLASAKEGSIFRFDDVSIYKNYTDLGKFSADYQKINIES